MSNFIFPLISSGYKQLKSNQFCNMSLEKNTGTNNIESSGEFGVVFPSSHKINLHSEDDGIPKTPCCSFPLARRRVRGACTTKLLKRRLPFLQWIPRCTFQSVIYDILAGFTVALTAIPQSIAYAIVAGVPLEVLLHKTNLYIKSNFHY